MKAIALCLVALFANTFAAFLLEEGGVENDPFGASSWEDELYEATTHDIDSKIAGGIETTIEDHPFIFSLRYIDKHRGEGSILTPVRGLTAAEHLRGDANPFTVMAGSTSIDGDENLQLRRLSRYLRHPNFDRPRAFQNNIAVLYWDEPFIFDDFVQPIALPPQGTVPDYTKSANVSGWGATREAGPGSKVLRTVSMPLVRNEKCNAPNSYNGSVTEDMLCAGLSRGERGACEGDSGGPLVVLNVLFGVASWGRGCARPHYPGIYTRVPYFTNWIKENL